MIKASAILFTEENSSFPVIMTGLRHADIFERMFQLGIKYNKAAIVQGFLTDDNRFLDRYDAKHEARRCNQLLPDVDDGRELFSEDIWPE